MSRASIEESWDWHKKLSHLNFNNINELVKKDLVRGLSKSVFAPDGLCDSCQKAKQRKSSFKSKTESSILEPYHLLHVDLFGLVNVMSITKKKYDMVIVDEFTRYTWVYFLHTKSETASILIDHVKQLDKLVKDSVKIIRIDNGTEFKNMIMEEFCKDQGKNRNFLLLELHSKMELLKGRRELSLKLHVQCLMKQSFQPISGLKLCRLLVLLKMQHSLTSMEKHHMRW